MDGRALASKLNYRGMERGIRQLAIDDKLAPLADIAAMSEVEVCDLVAQNYQLVYAEDEEIGLVHNDNAKQLFGMIKTINR